MNIRQVLDRIVSLSSLVEAGYKPGDKVYLKPGDPTAPHGEEIRVGRNGGRFFYWKAGAGHGGWEQRRRQARQAARQEAGQGVNNENQGIRTGEREVSGGRPDDGGRPVQRPAMAGAGAEATSGEVRDERGSPEGRVNARPGQVRAISRNVITRSWTLDDLGLPLGVNESHMKVVQIQPGQFLPRAGLSDDKAMIKSNPLASTSRRNEMFRYELDQLLGFDTVPDVLSIAGEPHSFMMRWVDACGFGGRDAHRVSRKMTDGQLKSFCRITALDACLGNTDRHGGNWLVDDVNDKVWAIDNEFGSPTSGGGREIISTLHWNLPDSEIYDKEEMREYLVEAVEEMRTKKSEVEDLLEKWYPGRHQIFDDNLTGLENCVKPGEWESTTEYWQ